MTVMENGGILKSYLIDQLTTAKKQLLSIGPDADTEALHRFRVALRRFRSVLDAYTKQLYAPDAVSKSIVKVTNPLRETDVFLASVDPALYPKLHAALTTFRRQQYKQIWKPDTAERFDRSLDTLIADLSKLDFDPPEKKLLRTGKKLYDAADKARKKLCTDSEEKLIHETRLKYKQARYVLEFLNASGLEETPKKIKKVKKLLDHFGAIQDAANQLEWLRAFCGEHPSDECTTLFAEREKELKKLKKAFAF